MVGSHLTGSRASLSAFIREMVMLWTEVTTDDRYFKQAMKEIERVADSLIRQVVSIDESQFLFQAEAQQMQSLSSTSCKRDIFLWASGFIWRS